MDIIYTSLGTIPIYGELDLQLWWFVSEVGETEGFKVMFGQSVLCSVASGSCIVIDILKVWLFKVKLI